MLDELFPAASVADHAVLITLTGKLRGRRARMLGARLSELADEGVTRVILDLRELTSLDSMATYALEEGLDRGLRLHIVVKPSFTFDGFFTSRFVNQRSLKTHHSLDQALAQVRQLMDSGLVLV